MVIVSFEITVYNMWHSQVLEHKVIWVFRVIATSLNFGSKSHHFEVGHMRLYSIMIKPIAFHNDRKYCSRSQAIAGVVIDHHISKNSLMRKIISVGFSPWATKETKQKPVETWAWKTWKLTVYRHSFGHHHSFGQWPPWAQINTDQLQTLYIYVIIWDITCEFFWAKWNDTIVQN